MNTIFKSGWFEVQINDDFSQTQANNKKTDNKKVAENDMFKLNGYEDDFEMKNDARSIPGRFVWVQSRQGRPTE